MGCKKIKEGNQGEFELNLAIKNMDKEGIVTYNVTKYKPEVYCNCMICKCLLYIGAIKDDVSTSVSEKIFKQKIYNIHLNFVCSRLHPYRYYFCLKCFDNHYGNFWG